ncbi:MAG: hypothetical protein AMXMBFR64_40000 [Myxococcales bacterium]
MSNLPRTLALLAILGLGDGCEAGGGSSVAPGESIDDEACEHLADGPFADVAASVDAPPDVSKGHTAHRVALADVAGGKGGAVAYANATAGDVTIFLSRDVPVAVTGPGGSPIVAEDSHKGSACSAIAVSHVFPLPVGTSTLTFGPTTETSVTVVIEAGHDHAD